MRNESPPSPHRVPTVSEKAYSVLIRTPYSLYVRGPLMNLHISEPEFLITLTISILTEIIPQLLIRVRLAFQF